MKSHFIFNRTRFQRERRERLIFCMEILSKTLEVNFKGEVTLEWVEKLFEEHKIKPLRWAITKVDNARGVLTLDFSYRECV